MLLKVNRKLVNSERNQMIFVTSAIKHNENFIETIGFLLLSYSVILSRKSNDILFIEIINFLVPDIYICVDLNKYFIRGVQ